MDPLHTDSKQPTSKDSQVTIVTQTMRIGISACLLGHPVRYDGGHKRQSFFEEHLDASIEWVAVCPEVEIGLGTPRETIGLYTDLKTPELRSNHTDKDLTQVMQTWSQHKLHTLEKLKLSGYIFKSRSPSCGLYSIDIKDRESGTVLGKGRGLFAQAVVQMWPLLPVAEEKQLQSPEAQTDFLIRVQMSAHWKHCITSFPEEGPWSVFHREYASYLETRGLYETFNKVFRSSNTSRQECFRLYGLSLQRIIQHPLETQEFECSARADNT